MRTRDQVHGGARESRLSSDWNEYKSPRYEQESKEELF